MPKKIRGGILAFASVAALLSPALANRNFVPDWTFKGSSLAAFRTLGAAEWRAENGEIVGIPKTPEGGWLILDRPLQDVQFASSYRCTGGCRAGVMVRAQSSPEGIRGVYAALPDGRNPAASYALKLDPQGREVSREALRPGTGTVRLLAVPTTAGRAGGAPPAAAPAAGRGATTPTSVQGAAPRAAQAAGRGGAPAGGRGGFGPFGALPPDAPYTRPNYAYRPNEWNPLELIMDANYLRVWVNDGPEGGTTNGQAGEDIAAYGPVALYIGGTGEVRFKQVEIKDLGRHVFPKEQTSSRFRMERLSEFYYGWSTAAADINRDGILDVVAGPFYYLGPDYAVAREIYVGPPSNVATTYTPAAISFSTTTATAGRTFSASARDECRSSSIRGRNCGVGTSTKCCRR